MHRGKAPPIDPYTEEDPEVRMDDWLPALKRAVSWNDWSEVETLMQLAGHLRGRALQEWNLLGETERSKLDIAVGALHSRLEQGSKAMAAQEFRHCSQMDSAWVADYIRWLEKTFRVAYGREALTQETRNALLYGQLHEGLLYRLMEAPAVSGAMDYSSLCLAARSEEHRQMELHKRKQYQSSQEAKRTEKAPDVSPQPAETCPPRKASSGIKRFNCRKIGHKTAEYRAKERVLVGTTQRQHQPKW